MFEEWASFRVLCHKCQRWYNAEQQHICVPAELDVTEGRRRLKRWLGEYEQMAQESEE